MQRRAYLRNAGLIGSIGLAGCLGGGAPEAANEFDYPTTTTDGVDVPLAPLDDVIEWYENEVGVYADARGQTAYENARIAGAVHSPAPDGQAAGDPLADLDSETRIITYCGCPHHLSTLRAATLIQNGHVHAYAIDEGFRAWYEAGYPLEGSAVEREPAAAGGDLAWAWHDPSGQREAAPIADDGSFTLTLHFYDVTGESPIRVVTPAGEVTGPLGSLTEGVVEL
jgi:rhodanese-related sulfurtransferase